MTSRIPDLIQHQAESPSALIKALNYLAALLGIGTFLHLVNVVVGLLSAAWLLVQLYAFVRYELPIKKAKADAARRGYLVPESKKGDLSP
jgi:hypothetical protein